MSAGNDDMVYDERFGWIDMPDDGDMMKALGITVLDHRDAIVYYLPYDGHASTLYVPKDQETIEALRECLDDAERKLKHETRRGSPG